MYICATRVCRSTIRFWAINHGARITLCCWSFMFFHVYLTPEWIQWATLPVIVPNYWGGADVHGFRPLIDFSHGAIDRRGTYRFFVSIAIARWVQYAVHLWSPTILGDGVYARLPTVKGSTFVAFCTEYSARMSWAQTALRGRFNWVPTDYAPPIPENLQSTFERLREYLLSEQIFDGISE